MDGDSDVMLLQRKKKEKKTNGRGGEEPFLFTPYSARTMKVENWGRGGYRRFCGAHS
jgi:hypothetical protein